MKTIRTGPEDRRKGPAGSFTERALKSLRTCARLARCNRPCLAVREKYTAHIDGPAKTMLADARTGLVIAGSASIGGGNVNDLRLGPQMVLRRW